MCFAVLPVAQEEWVNGWKCSANENYFRNYRQMYLNSLCPIWKILASIFCIKKAIDLILKQIRMPITPTFFQ